MKSLKSLKYTLSSAPERERLSAAITTVRHRFEGYKHRPNPNPNRVWVDCTEHSLRTAEKALEGKDCNAGWGALHDAERSLVLGMTHEELLTQAIRLEEETQNKLSGWRGGATARLFGSVAFAEWIRAARVLQVNEHGLLQEVVLEALGLLQEENNNKYHRLRLVRKQLQFLVIACATVLVVALASSAWWAPDDSMFRFAHLGPVALAGALGGVVSGMFQLSRVGEAKIPEGVLHGLITFGRPLIGAACALFVYAVMRSKIISLIDLSKITDEAGLVLGFVAGLSEQFVLSTVSKISGIKIEGPSPNVVVRAVVAAADKGRATAGSDLRDGPFVNLSGGRVPEARP